MTFASSETGAVTVDWVVLTAALVGLGLATMTVVSGGVDDLSGDVDGTLQSKIITTGFVGSSLATVQTYSIEGCPGGLAAVDPYLDAYRDVMIDEGYDEATLMLPNHTISTANREDYAEIFNDMDNNDLLERVGEIRADAIDKGEYDFDTQSYTYGPTNASPFTDNVVEATLAECIAAERGLTPWDHDPADY